MRMKSKTVIITGGGKGIGFGVATAFAKEGADIVITGRQGNWRWAAKEKALSPLTASASVMLPAIWGWKKQRLKVVAKAIEMTGRLTY